MTDSQSSTPTPHRSALNVRPIWDESRDDWHAAVVLIVAGDDVEHSDALAIVVTPKGRTLRVFAHDDRDLPACARALNAVQNLLRMECLS